VAGAAAEKACMMRFLPLRRPLLTLLLGASLALDVGAAPPVCGRLCAAWQLDPAASSDPKAAIDTAVTAYKEEKPKRRRAPGSDFASLARAELEESLGPMRERPMREELREELTHLLVIPGSLRISLEGDEVRIDEGRGGPRRFDLGESYSRVDDLGTAEVSAQFQGNGFRIREKYRKGRGSNRETYQIEARTDRLVVTRTIERPKMPDIVVRSVYRPAP
jgi:hypothetical protein